MLRVVFATLLSAGVLAACGDDDDNATCPSLGGNWVVTDHCQTDLIGSSVSVAQNGCTLTTSGAAPGFQGTVGPNGELSIQGSAGGQGISCTGTATPTRVTQICTGNCAVSLERPP